MTLVGYASSPDGDLVQKNNVFSGSGSPESSGSVPNPPYSYSMDKASSIPSIVSSGAGANGTTGGGDDGDDDDDGDPSISASATAGNGYVYLTWKINNITNTGTEVYRDTDSDPSGRVRIASVGSSTSYTDYGVSNGNTYYYWIKVKDSDGTFYNSDALKATPSSSASKSAEESQLTDVNYNVNVYPNPFSNSTKIRFNLKEEQNVSISVYSMSGKLIDKTESDYLQSGMNEIKYENNELTNGLYIMTIRFKDKVENTTLIVK